jgi:hypothetical protein
MAQDGDNPSSIRIGGWVPKPSGADPAPKSPDPVTERSQPATVDPAAAAALGAVPVVEDPPVATGAPDSGAPPPTDLPGTGLAGRPTRRVLIAAAVTAAVAAGVPIALNLDSSPEPAAEVVQPAPAGPAVPWPQPEPATDADPTSPAAHGPSATPGASRRPAGQRGATGTAKPRTPPRAAPPPPVSISLEGESPIHSFSGITRHRSNPDASGGAVAGWVGNDPDNVVRLAVNVPTAGTYTVTMFYISESSRRAVIRVNGGSAKAVDFPPTGDWSTVRSLSFRFVLRAGKNAISVGNPDDWGPDIDRLTVTR